MALSRRGGKDYASLCRELNSELDGGFGWAEGAHLIQDGIGDGADTGDSLLEALTGLPCNGAW